MGSPLSRFIVDIAFQSLEQTVINSFEFEIKLSCRYVAETLIYCWLGRGQ